MTTKTANEKTKDYTDQAKADDDGYILIHFSESEKKSGVHIAANTNQAMNAIHQIADAFGIDLMVLAMTPYRAERVGDDDEYKKREAKSEA